MRIQYRLSRTTGPKHPCSLKRGMLLSGAEIYSIGRHPTVGVSAHPVVGRYSIDPNMMAGHWQKLVYDWGPVIVDPTERS